jgi:hypothetical protein
LLAATSVGGLLGSPAYLLGLLYRL